MLLNILHTITDFAVLVTRLTTEEFADEQRMVLIDQFMRLQGIDAAFEFDLHDLLMILITVLIIIFCTATPAFQPHEFVVIFAPTKNLTTPVQNARIAQSRLK